MAEESEALEIRWTVILIIIPLQTPGKPLPWLTNNAKRNAHTAFPFSKESVLNYRLKSCLHLNLKSNPCKMAKSEWKSVDTTCGQASNLFRNHLLSLSKRSFRLEKAVIAAFSVFDSCHQLTVNCCQVRVGAATDSRRGNKL